MNAETELKIARAQRDAMQALAQDERRARIVAEKRVAELERDNAMLKRPGVVPVGDWLGLLGALVCEAKNDECGKSERELRIDKAHSELFSALRKLNASVAPVGEVQAKVEVTLPERVIDQLWQAAAVSTFHPDGDQAEALRDFARNVVAETLARIPAHPDDAAVESDALASMTRMFREACYDLGLISEALGLDPDDGGGADLILDAIEELRAAAPQPAAQEIADRFASLQALVEHHAAELEANPYAYFELAYSRRTEWMVWICSRCIDDDPNRKVIARGQGRTPEEACQRAIEILDPAIADGATPDGGA